MSTVAAERALNESVEDRATALLRIREDQWFDRKSVRITGKDLAESLVAFANADGGFIVIGLWDGQVEGISQASGGRVSEWQQAAFDFTIPSAPARTRLVECINRQGERDQLLVIEIQPSQQVHATRRDDVFLRVGDENRRLTFAQRQELVYDKGQSNFETTVVASADLADLDQGLLGAYAEALHHPESLRLLSARGLITRSDQLTVGAVLLFSAQPQRWFPEASIRVLRYRGVERGTGARQQLLHDRRIDGPIPHQLAEARKEIFGLLPTRSALGRDGLFEKIGLIPQDAWLEALVNAAVHRSYSVSGDHIRVEIFDDRIEIESPGRFPGIADTSDPLRVTRFARNPRIARVCADLAFGQELGEGIRRIFEEMRLAGLSEPSYFQSSGSVRLTLSSAPVDRELEGRLPPGARDIARLVRESGRLSTGEIIDASGLSRPVVIRQLKSLQDAGILERFGRSPKDPRAYWALQVK
jgi:ATP-dependent DNA helicase RecG